MFTYSINIKQDFIFYSSSSNFKCQRGGTATSIPVPTPRLSLFSNGDAGCRLYIKTKRELLLTHKNG